MYYGYLVLVSGIAVVWLVLFVSRKDVRSKMLWCGGYWVAILSLGFLILWVFFPHLSPEQRIVPGYWNPDTLFDLGRTTGGWSIEDVLYMFFTGGIACALYDILGKRTVRHVEGSVWRRRRTATLIPAAIVCAMAFLLSVNLIWELTAFCVLGALLIWYLRPDIIVRSLVGGIAYAALYYILFAFVFLGFFPDFLTQHYNLANLSGMFVGALPLEEILFALFFGLMWSSMYEYAKDIRPSL